jgi:hypothetical protein
MRKLPSSAVNPRLRAACDLMMSEVREYAGRHEYDGHMQDLSPAGVAAALARLGDGPPEEDAHDEAHLQRFEAGLRTVFGTVEEHRRNPLVHVDNLDVSCYDRTYAPEPERAEARRRHLARWPDGVDAAIQALDRVPRVLADAVLPVVAGLREGVDDPTANAAAARLQAHVESAVVNGDPDVALGAPILADLLAASEGMPVDLDALARTADRERDRLRERLVEDCGRYRAGASPAEVIAELRVDHPTTSEEIYTQARAQIEEVTAFTRARDLLPELGGTCLVGPAPPARRMAMAMMSWSAPFEPDAPSWYYVTPPDDSWSDEQRRDWLEVFSATTLPAITIHEVTPGHYAHGRMLRGLDSDVRRCLFSLAFVEGWAHYAEELFVEEGFRAGDPRFAIGVWLEALLRVTRLACSIGVHTSTMTLDDAIARMGSDAFLSGEAARSEALRATWDPSYGRYTWGKLEILALRDEARRAWGAGFTPRRFHESILALGAPPLGLMRTARTP